MLLRPLKLLTFWKFVFRKVINLFRKHSYPGYAVTTRTAKACAQANSAGTTEPLNGASHFAVQYQSGRIPLLFIVRNFLSLFAKGNPTTPINIIMLINFKLLSFFLFIILRIKAGYLKNINLYNFHCWDMQNWQFFNEVTF